MPLLVACVRKGGIHALQLVTSNNETANDRKESRWAVMVNVVQGGGLAVNERRRSIVSWRHFRE